MTKKTKIRQYEIQQDNQHNRLHHLHNSIFWRVYNQRSFGRSDSDLSSQQEKEQQKEQFEQEKEEQQKEQKEEKKFEQEKEEEQKKSLQIKIEEQA